MTVHLTFALITCVNGRSLQARLHFLALGVEEVFYDVLLSLLFETNFFKMHLLVCYLDKESWLLNYFCLRFGSFDLFNCDSLTDLKLTTLWNSCRIGHGFEVIASKLRQLLC